MVKVFSLKWRKRAKARASNSLADGWPIEADMASIAYDAMLEAGQVKAEFTDLTLSNFTEHVEQTFDLAAATPPVMSELSIYPKSTATPDFTAMFDAARTADNPVGINGKLIENPVNKQHNLWRIIVDYTGKAINANIGLEFTLKNPTSGFIVRETVTLPTGETAGTFSILISSIADSNSIPAPGGYLLSAISTVTDAGLSVSIKNITRFNNPDYVQEKL